MRSYSSRRTATDRCIAHPMYSSIFWCRIYLSTDSSRSRYFSKSRPCRVCFFTATTSPKYFPMYTVENAPSPTAGPIVTCNKMSAKRSSTYISQIFTQRLVLYIPGTSIIIAQVTHPHQMKYTRCSSNRNEFTSRLHSRS